MADSSSTHLTCSLILHFQHHSFLPCFRFSSPSHKKLPTHTTTLVPLGLDPQHHVFYYQGLHDVASVLLLELGGEARAFPLLCKLVTCQLRDCTRPR